MPIGWLKGASESLIATILIARSRLSEKAIGEFPGVASEPVAQIGIEAFGDSSITIAYRFWIPTPSYFETQYAVNRGVFKALREAAVTIPFPQREIRMRGAAS